MNREGIRLFFPGADTNWVMDAEKLDDDLVIFGFEEHVLDDEKEQVFKTEQVLDKDHLKSIKLFIDSILVDL